MPQFVVLIHAEDSAHAPTATKEELAECDAHFDALAATGRMSLAYALTPREHARALSADGPRNGAYREDGHLIAGFYVLEAADIEEALDLARKDPSLLSGGGIEVRPVHSGGVVGTT